MSSVTWSNQAKLESFQLVCNIVQCLLVSSLFFVEFNLRVVSASLGHNALGLLMTYSFKLSYPLQFTIESLYLFFYGPAIAQLLDSQLLTRSFDCHLTNWLIFILLFLLTNFTYVEYYHRTIIQAFIAGSWIKFIRLFCLYLVHLRQYLTWLMIHFVKHATRKQLKESLRQLQNGHLNREQIIKSVKTLSQINAQFNHLVSFLLLTFVVFNVLEVLLTLTRMVIHGRLGNGNISYIALTSMYIAYIMFIDYEIQKILIQLIKHLKRQSDPWQTLEHLVFNSNYSGLTSDQVIQIVQHSHMSSISRFKQREIQIYQEYFRLELFQLCAIDFRFFLYLIAFIMGQFVLSIQTDDRFKFHTHCSC